MPTNNPNTQSSSQPTSKGATEAASNRIEQGGRRVESSIEQLEKTAEHAASTAINRVREAREQATSGIVQQRDQIADRIHKVGTLLRSGSETLADEDPLAHSVLSFVGDTADGIARYVRDATPGAVADDLQSFARRRPGVFFGGAFLIGLAVGRFVKASAPSTGGGDREDLSRYGESDYEAPEYRSYASTRARPTPAAVASSYASTPSTTSSTSSSQSQGASSGGTSLPYVSAGNTIGAAPSSATYGASTATGTSGGSEAGTPSYGSPTVGGTGGYAPQGASSKGPMVSRASQPSPALREAPDAPANPLPHAVREGEGTKS